MPVKRWFQISQEVIDHRSGDVAQVGERYVRNVQVRGSSPLISTIFFEGTATNFQLTYSYQAACDGHGYAGCSRATGQSNSIES